MPTQPSQRALDFMRSILPEQRKCSRVQLTVQAAVIFYDSNLEPITAFLRDINMLGAFFYCGQKPTVGQHARLQFAVMEPADQLEAIGEGTIVRVEEFVPGAAIGVAMEFTHYQVTRLPKQEEAAQSLGERPEDPSFIGWTVEMVERMLRRSSPFVHLTSGCENAA